MFTQPYVTTLHSILTPLLEAYPDYKVLDFQQKYTHRPNPQLVLFNRFLHQIEREGIPDIHSDKINRFLRNLCVHLCYGNRCLDVSNKYGSMHYLVYLTSDLNIEYDIDDCIYFNQFKSIVFNLN